MTDLETYGEIREMYMNADERKKQEVLSFLCFCAERLKEGATVPEIWNEWQEVNA